MRLPKSSNLTAADIMSQDLVTVPLTATLEALALILHENHISGAPVVDADGHLVGVVSQSDLVKSGTRPKARIVPLEAVQCEDGEDEASPYYSHLDGSDVEELRAGFIEEDYGDSTVADIFTPYTVTAAPDTPVTELARLMVDKEVHRLIILEGRRVAGIVTSMDILRSMARPHQKPEPACLVAH